MFNHLRVVEFATVLAGPAVGMFFAELGAHVLKIENPTTGGDVTRGWKLPTEDPDAADSAYFHSVNWGKEHLWLDFNDPAQCAHAQALAIAADVVVANFKPSAARRYGLDAATLRTTNPRLIYAQLNAFADPNDESPAFDVVLQAEAGFLYMNGEPQRPPVKMPVALIDLLAAHQLKEGILMALLQRERTGTGSLVSTSLMASAVASLANQASNWLNAKHIPQPMGTRHPNIAPYGDVFTCADGLPLLLAVGTEKQFRQLCTCLDTRFLSEDVRFVNNAARVVHREVLNQWLATEIVKQPLPYWMALFKTNGVPAARIRDMEAVFEMPEAQAMILTDAKGNRSVRTVAVTVTE